MKLLRQVSAAPDEVGAVKAVPSNVSEGRRFLRMTSHLGKFLPHLAERRRPLNNQNTEMLVSADSSSYGTGAVLLQSVPHWEEFPH